MKTWGRILGVSLVAGVLACESTSTTYEDHFGGRIPLVLRLDLHHPSPIFPGTQPTADGWHVISIEPDSGQRGAELSIRPTGYREGIEFEMIARRDTAAATLATRYLSADHFDEIEARLTLEGVVYTGLVERFDLDADLYRGIAYGAMVVRFEAVDEGHDPLYLGAELAGYMESVCVIEGGGSSARSTVNMLAHIAEDIDMTDKPPACVEIFEALRSTPDDPNGPPPPYSLDDTLEGGGGSIPMLDFGVDAG